jgi:hypothetical protein
MTTRAQRTIGDTRSLALKNLATLSVIAAITLVVRIIVLPERFADFWAYVYILDDIVNSNWNLIQFGEPVSWGILYFFRIISGDSYGAIVIGNYYLSAIYLCFSAYALYRYKLSWQSLIIIFAAYGAILDFVIIRATHAYFIVLFAALDSREGKWRCLPMCIIASLFHISALLAFIPLVASLAQAKSIAVDRLFRSRYIAPILGITIILPSILFRSDVIEIMNTLFGLFGNLFSRFTVYTADSSSATGYGEGGSMAQQIYFLISSGAVLISLLIYNKFIKGLQGYILTSYGIYILMFLNPPSAFRESIFWMMPLIAVFPWNKLSFHGFGTAALGLASIALFWIGLNQAIV